MGVGVGVYGVAFGCRCWWHERAERRVVFAGASQIVAVERLWQAPALVSPSLQGLALNLRLLLVTASLRNGAGRPAWQVALGAHMATDETGRCSMQLEAGGKALVIGIWLPEVWLWL